MYGIITHDPSSHINLPLGLPRQCGKPMHQQFKKKKKKKKRLHILTLDAMQGCGVTSLVVCINGKSSDTRERIVTIRSDI